MRKSFRVKKQEYIAEICVRGSFKSYGKQWGVGVGVSDFPEKNVMKVYGSMLLALLGGWVGVK